MSETNKIIENLKNSGRKVEEFYTGNKTSDKNVGSIDEKAVNDDIELIKNLIENNKIEIKNVSVGQEFRLLRTLQNILAEREQDKKRIKELEEERNHWHGCFIVAMENSIAKEKVKNVLKNNRNEIFSATYLSREQFRPYEMQIERINKIEQELIGEDK